MVGGNVNSIPFLDDRYPVRTVYTDSADWQRHADWQHFGTRNAALQDFVRTPLKRIVYAFEAHSGNVLAVSDEGGGFVEVAEVTDAMGLTDGCDALVTAAPGVMLCVRTADCLPLFLYDSKKHAAAIAHCGWRNICNGIVSNTVDMMAERFGTNPKDAIAAFGPGICGKCYEVGNELVKAFSKRLPASARMSRRHIRLTGETGPRSSAGKCCRESCSHEVGDMNASDMKQNDEVLRKPSLIAGTTKKMALTYVGGTVCAAAVVIIDSL